jgi:hypothetical protein
MVKKQPDALAGTDVERLHRARRVAAVLQAIGDARSNDDEVLVDDGGDVTCVCRRGTSRPRGSRSARRGAAAGKVAIGFPLIGVDGEEALTGPAMKTRVSPASPRQTRRRGCFRPVPLRGGPSS